MLVGIGVFLVANATALLGARLLLARIRTGISHVDLVQFLVLRLLLVSSVVLVAGLTGTLSAPWLGAAGVVTLVGLIIAGAHRGWTKPRFPKAGGFLWCFAGLVAIRLLLQVWFFAPHLGDAVAYHLPKVAEWVRAGGFTREMGLHPHVTFPAGFELVETWWVAILRHDVLIEVAGLEFLLLAVCSVYALGRHAGLGERASFFGALAYGLSPGLHLSSTSCLNDAPAAAVVTAVAVLVYARASWGIVAAAAGLGVGIKATTGFAFPGFLLLAWLVRREVRPSQGLRSMGILVGVLGTGLGAFWYARNYLWFGNPFYPLGSAGIENPVAVQLGPSLSSLVSNLRDLLNTRILDNVAASGANVDHGAGWGSVAVSLGLPSLVAGSGASPRLRWLGVSYGLALGFTLLFVQNDPWCLKYAFYFPALLVVSSAWMIEKHRNLHWIGVGGLVVSFTSTVLPYDLPAASLGRLATQPWSMRSALGLWGPDSAEEVVAVFGGYSMRSYLLYRPDFSRRVIYVRGDLSRSRLDELRKNGVLHLYARPGSASEEERLQAAVDAGLIKCEGVFYYRLE